MINTIYSKFNNNPKPAIQGIDLNVMSFNIRYGTAKDGKNSWSHRRELVMNILKDNHWDIIGLQEALNFQLEEIRKEMHKYGSSGLGRDDGKDSGEHSSILYRTDRFKIAKSGTFWFSTTPSVPGSKDWGAKMPRICSWVQFIEKETKKNFLVYNVHLDHRSSQSRWKSMELLSKHIEIHSKNKIPVIVMGDFNVGENNPIIRYMKGENVRFGNKERNMINPYPLNDSFRSVHKKASGTTFHMFWGNKFGPKLDYIFTSKNSTIIESVINRISYKGKYPSDHYPVASKVILK
ncbi:endonuclease/exonuclease/phosphatase family protein [Chitinispirillales bacterium ANBcel5]|uniref:endonuclease/exonuclease/phosphatase family protein n=1 Tax=Cellulosispirillum alkaliphilum TaxID=3039283 RepID=UPI002A570530|nr:endonuclease/exonuclease/phosphatase family protein [Chitinispirillales bacterium ANBcel5]